MSGLPGNVAAIGRGVTALRAASDRVDGAADAVAVSRDVRWRGDAAAAFQDRMHRIAGEAADIAAVLSGASGILGRYADALGGQQGRVDDVERRIARSRQAVEANPLDLGAYASLTRDGIAQRALVSELEQAARVAAADLLALSGESGWGDAWWDPFGRYDEGDAHRDVPDDILERESFDPDDINQGGIGSCALLSALASLMRTDKGDQLIRDHVRWDEEKDGYWVTLYDRWGEPVEYFVDKVHENGSEDFVDGLIFDGARANLESLYEAAAAQHLTYRGLDNGMSGVDAIRLLTGQESQYYVPRSPDSSSDWPSYVDEWDDIVDRYRRGALMVAGTVDYWDDYAERIPVEISRRDDDGHIVSAEEELLVDHAYSVVAVERDGDVWLRNPWGRDNSADGGGEFRLSAEDFRRYFSNLTVAGAS